mgnify:CR=1 FL=1
MKRAKSSRSLGILPALFFVALAGITFDFFAFANRAAESVPAVAREADGVVALTGGSGMRIAAGVDLVTAGRGERLLISGVNPDVGMDDLITLAGGAAVWILATAPKRPSEMRKKRLYGPMSTGIRA